MLPTTVRRVPLNTSPDVNQQIRDETRRNVEELAGGTDRAIEQRLHQLEEEWDIERMLEANAATVALAGVALGTFVDRRFYILPAIVGGFLLQHALQGWCPPVPIFRRLGFRTQPEIARERYALKAIRGDFRDVQAGRGGADQALRAVGR